MRSRPSGPSFNEAPAECGGKHEQLMDAIAFTVFASMRPPQNAGENWQVNGSEIARILASMRPPQNAGENYDIAIQSPA